MTPTAEQLAIVEAAQTTSDNLLIEARAGAAKTTTLVLLAEALPHVQIISLAFNVAIKKEMEARLPTNCRALTLNGLGHRAFGQFLSRRLILDEKKNYRLLQAAVDKLSERDRREFNHEDLFVPTLRYIREAKQQGFVPPGCHSMARPLLSPAEFFAGLDERPFPVQEEIVITVLRAGFKEAMGGLIDFDDQILMPAIMPVYLETPDLTLVDEAQDLSAINHVLLGKLVSKKGRIIAVGDPCQAIYGFRGAHENSMAELRAQFSMRTLYLTVSFRCPQAVVREALWRAPDMKYPDWAKPGEVRTLPAWSPDDIPAGAAIICRNNAPLFTNAFRLLRAGKYPELAGRDIMRGLVRILQKLGKGNLDQEEVLLRLESWYNSELLRTRKPEVLNDKYECLKVIAEQGSTLSDAIAWAQHLDRATGQVRLMTGHKSKGLEFEEVFILDQILIRDEGQDRNLRYVMQTRSQLRLTYITSDGFLAETI